MGLDLNLFVEPVEDELKCPICYRVLSNPVCGRNCDHLFCNSCILAWIHCAPECPMDRTPFSECDLRPAPKIIQGLLARLEIKCTNWEKGCCWIMQCKDLDNHLMWCLFDSTNPKFNLIPDSPSNFNTIKQIRMIADQSDDLKSIKESVELLKTFYEEEEQRSLETQQKIKKLSNWYRELNEHFHEATSPLSDLLLSAKECAKEKDEAEEKDDNQEVETVSVRNLNEFITSSILTEYLRQNDIYVLGCETECCHWQRSRDFRVEIRTKDLKSILSPELWPRGVSVCALGPKSLVVFGHRDKDAASIVLQPGIIC